MSDRPQRGRDDLLDDLVGMITATLATRSDDELAMLVEALESGHFTGLEALPVVNEAVMVQVDPAASKDAVREALHGLQAWVEDHWESLHDRITGIPIPAPPSDPGMLN